jgi:hypothetical protein
MESCLKGEDAKVGLRGIDGLESIKVANLIYKSAREGIRILNNSLEGSK